MARTVSNTHTRMVLAGSDTAPTTLWAEYRVENGDLKERPKRLDFESPSFTNSINTLWAAQTTAIKSSEGIS